MSQTQSKREAAKQRYNRVLRVVMHNTHGPHGPQRAGCRPTVIKGICCQAGHSPDDVTKSLRAAKQNGDLLEYSDDEGRIRYARTTDAGMRQVIGEQNAREHPDRELIERCVTVMDS